MCVYTSTRYYKSFLILIARLYRVITRKNRRQEARVSQILFKVFSLVLLASFCKVAAPIRIHVCSRKPKILKNASNPAIAIACVQDRYLNWKWKVWILEAPACVFSEHVISTAALAYRATGLITCVVFFYQLSRRFSRLPPPLLLLLLYLSISLYLPSCPLSARVRTCVLVCSRLPAFPVLALYRRPPRPGSQD